MYGKRNIQPGNLITSSETGTILLALSYSEMFHEEDFFLNCMVLYSFSGYYKIGDCFRAHICGDCRWRKL